MKKSKLNWMLAALMVLVIAPTVVKTRTKTKPAVDLTNYYWYDASGIFLNRQNTIANEMNLTGFDESLSNPKTLQEYGYAPVNVNPSPYPPTPIWPNNPDKILYSHP